MTEPEKAAYDDAAQRAQNAARYAHFGQSDKNGSPYIGHPARVAHRVREHGIEAVQVGWLHDVVEDTDVTLSDLRDWHFSEAVVEAVDAITKRDGESRDGYYERVKANPLALIVKAADIADNTDEDRLALLDSATAARLRKKYAHARERLGLA